MKKLHWILTWSRSAAHRSVHTATAAGPQVPCATPKAHSTGFTSLIFTGRCYTPPLHLRSFATYCFCSYRSYFLETLTDNNQSNNTDYSTSSKRAFILTQNPPKELLGVDSIKKGIHSLKTHTRRTAWCRFHSS